MIFVVILLIITLIVVGILYFMVEKQLAYYKLISKGINVNTVTQNMFNIMGDNISAENKINELNKAIIQTYNPKYSTIALFDGNVYEARATNVESTYLDIVSNLAEENDFKANAMKNVCKYITTSPEKTLSYRSAVERKIKSAMFSPIYYNKVYLGFWIMEDTRENAFDDISKSELTKIKANMGVFIENTKYQSAIEKAENIDKQTGFFNNMYLYSNIRHILNETENNVITLLCIKNLPEINTRYNREIGNKMLIKVAEILKSIVPEDSVLVRNSGLRLMIISKNTNVDTMNQVIERVLSRVTTEVEYCNNEEIKPEVQILMHNIVRQNNIEKEIDKMINYMDNMNEKNTIKII